MFSTIKKIIKWTFITVGVLFTAIVIAAFNDPKFQADRASEKAERVEAQSVDDLKRTLESKARTQCINRILAEVKYPDAVAWKRSTLGRPQADSDAYVDGAYIVMFKGRALNDFGAMLPFTAGCEVKIDDKNKTVELTGFTFV